MADSESSIYFYDPSLPASILFTALYAVPAVFLLYTTVVGPRTGKYRHAKFFIPVCIGAVMEVAGYAVRCGSIKKQEDASLFATSSSLVVLAPVFVCASLYLLLGRLVRAGIPLSGKQQRIMGISPRWLPRAFITSDILSFLTQGGGSAIASSNSWQGTEKETGTNVLIGGLALQLFTFSMFLLIVSRFHVRARQIGDGLSEGVRQVLIGIYIAGFFIEIRCIYRLIEFILGIDGYPFRQEWLLYVLEACPMLFALCVLGYYHPGKWLPAETILASRKRSQGDLESE